MADAAISIAFPVSSGRRTNIGAIATLAITAATEFFRKRWIYHRTLSELDGYSRHSLLDIGADHGIDEFARRAARL